MAYAKFVEAHLQALNQLSLSSDANQQKSILNALSRADKAYLKVLGKATTKSIRLTRHGKCSAWHKKAGLRPNATIAPSALLQMHKASQSNKLFPSDKPMSIFVSPMIRAQQTASVVLPKHLPQDSKITKLKDLSEISAYPSGNVLSSREELKRCYRKLSFRKNFGLKLLYGLSLLLFGSKSYFKSIKVLANQNKRVLMTKAHQTALQSIAGTKTSNRLINTLEAIKNSPHDTVWCFGHGKHFKALLRNLFGGTQKFSYGETQILYAYESPAGMQYFKPPYTLVISQTTGKLEAKYEKAQLNHGIQASPTISKLKSPLKRSTSSSYTTPTKSKEPRIRSKSAVEALNAYNTTPRVDSEIRAPKKT